MNKEKEENKNRDTDQDQRIEVDGKSHIEQVAKVTMSKKSETLISELVARVNSGFEFGRLTRHQLISWILTKFAEECTEPDIRAIRADHFDEIALLELSLKKFKQVGSLPPELRKVLLSQAGMDDMLKRPNKKAS
jgi:hypothetical protein